MLHPEKYLDLRDFFCGQGRHCGDQRVARSLGRWRVALASKLPEATSVQSVMAGKLVEKAARSHAARLFVSFSMDCSSFLLEFLVDAFL